MPKITAMRVATATIGSTTRGGTATTDARRLKANMQGTQHHSAHARPRIPHTRVDLRRRRASLTDHLHHTMLRKDGNAAFTAVRETAINPSYSEDPPAFST